MNDDKQLLSFLDSTPDSILYEYMVSFDKIKSHLFKFGLSPNESKVFIYLGKYGSKTAIEISRTLKIARAETYRILNVLQNKGIVSAAFDHPTRFSCLPIEDAINVLIEAEMANVKTLQTQKDNIVDLWQAIPMFNKKAETCEEKFQMVKGQNSILSKIDEMFSGATKNLLALCPEKFFAKLYYSNSLDILHNCKANLRVLTSSQKSMHIFKGISKAKIRKMHADVQNTLCFIVKDDFELISFVKNNVGSQDMLAIRTDCSSLIYTMTLLFNQIWYNSQTMNLSDSLTDSSSQRDAEDILYAR
jgi:sugar-specific transcriptional regulator TrmB